MKVRDVMVRNVVAIEPSASLAEAARRMYEANVGILPVVEAGEVLGVITDRDLVARTSASDADLVSTPVGRGEAMDPREASEFGFRRALITLDGSITAEAILPEFLRMARPLGMEVALVRVVVPPARPAPSEDTPDALENTARMLKPRRRRPMSTCAPSPRRPPSPGFECSRRCGRARLPRRSSPPRGSSRPT